MKTIVLIVLAATIGAVVTYIFFVSPNDTAEEVFTTSSFNPAVIPSSPSKSTSPGGFKTQSFSNKTIVVE